MAQEAMDNMAGPPPYPVQYSVEYPESSSRLKALFRLILIIPIAVLYLLVSGINGALFPALVLMLLFRKKYPRWWFEVNLEVERFTARCGAYLSLLRDEYPSTDEEQAVRLEHRIPRRPKRSDPVAAAHQVAAGVAALDHHRILSYVWIIVVVISWFAIIITGRHPRPLFDFLVGYGRWAYRTVAYAILLTTDRYPPFRFGP